MVDIQHEESVQVTVSQSAMTEFSTLGRFRLVKLIACKNEGRQILLHLLRKGQQFLGVRLLRPRLLGSCSLDRKSVV